MDKMDKVSQLEMILNGSNQMILVCDAQTHETLYANDAAVRFAANSGQSYKGRFQYMIGLDAPCGYCPIQKLEENSSYETEVDNGNQVYPAHRIGRQKGHHRIRLGHHPRKALPGGI